MRFGSYPLPLMVHIPVDTSKPRLKVRVRVGCGNVGAGRSTGGTRLVSVRSLVTRNCMIWEVPTTFDLDQYVYGALAAGASGFLLKDVTPEHLTAAVTLVSTGDALLSPSITRRLVERFARPEGDAAPISGDLSALTPRELEVLRYVARGLSNAEVAERMTLSEATVKTHLARVFAKLELRDRVQAVVVAYETGLIRPVD